MTKENDDYLWQDPIPLLQFRQLPKITPEMMPNTISDIVFAIAAATETPPELSVLFIIAVIATATQGKYEIELEPEYTEPTTHWTVVLMDPGNRKSAMLNHAIEPLRQWELDCAEKIRPKIKELKIKKDIHEQKIKKIRKQLIQSRDSKETRDLEQKLHNLVEKKITIPYPPRAIIQDITPEEIAVHMEKHNNSASILSDEGGFFDNLSRYSSTPNLDIVLQGHAGGDVYIDRGCRDPIHLHKPTLTLALSPQRSVILGLSRKKGFAGRGLIDRPLYLLPTSLLGYRPLSPTPIPTEIKDLYHTATRNLLSQKITVHKGQIRPQIISISQDAWRVWKDFSHSVEKDMRPNGRLEHVRGWAGKLPGQIGRISANYHCIIHHMTNPADFPLTAKTMQQAILLAQVIIDHTIEAFYLMGADQTNTGAEKILEWIETNHLRRFSRRDCFTRFRGFFHTVKDLSQSLQTLEDRHYIRKTRKQTGQKGRPSLSYETNPECFIN